MMPPHPQHMGMAPGPFAPPGPPPPGPRPPGPPPPSAPDAGGAAGGPPPGRGRKRGGKGRPGSGGGGSGPALPGGAPGVAEDYCQHFVNTSAAGAGSGERPQNALIGAARLRQGRGAEGC
jgi:hypothetical protein